MSTLCNDILICIHGALIWCTCVVIGGINIWFMPLGAWPVFVVLCLEMMWGKAPLLCRC